MGKLSVLERFWKYTDTNGACWTWVGALNNAGYAQFSSGSKCRQAHRWSYENFVAPIPDGMVIDHLCGNTACVKPQHLEPVTHETNLHRKRAARHDCASKVMGVHQNGKNWSVRFTRRGVSHYFGTYPTVQEATVVAKAARASLDACAVDAKATKVTV